MKFSTVIALALVACWLGASSVSAGKCNEIYTHVYDEFEEKHFLVRVSIKNGKVKRVGKAQSNEGYGVAYDSTSKSFYQIDNINKQNPRLVQVDKKGNLNAIGSLRSAFDESIQIYAFALAINSRGDAYTVIPASAELEAINVLAEVDLATGRVRNIAPMELPSPCNEDCGPGDPIPVPIGPGLRERRLAVPIELGTVTDIAFDQKDELYVMTSDGKLFRINVFDGTSTRLGGVKGLPNRYVNTFTTIAFDDNNEMYGFPADINFFFGGGPLRDAPIYKIDTKPSPRTTLKVELVTDTEVTRPQGGTFAC